MVLLNFTRQGSLLLQNLYKFELRLLLKSTMGTERIKVDTKKTTNPDGSITKTVTTTTATTHEDGTVNTKTKVETFIEGIPTGGNGGESGKKSKTKNVPPGTISTTVAAQQMKNAPRVKNTTDKKFIQEVLDVHNELRAKHGHRPIAIDEDVAQGWADVLAKKGQMAHSTNGYGENVFWASGGTVTGRQAVEAWYSEIKDFNFNKIDHTPGTGHFTQLLWNDSTKLGVALASGKNGIYVVCNYNPPGKYPQNIFPPKKK